MRYNKKFRQKIYALVVTKYPGIALTFCIVIIAYTMQSSATVPEKQEYVCHPCGAACDKAIYTTPGTCAHCQMPLVKKQDVVFKNISPVKLCSIVSARPDILLLDVRTVKEFEGKAPENFGRLKNAVNIPVQELEKRIAELKYWKNKEIIVYCSHSHRSPWASHVLTQNGFGNVTNMLGGMSTWKDRPMDNSCSKQLLVK